MRKPNSNKDWREEAEDYAGHDDMRCRVCGATVNPWGEICTCGAGKPFLFGSEAPKKLEPLYIRRDGESEEAHEARIKRNEAILGGKR